MGTVKALLHAAYAAQRPEVVAEVENQRSLVAPTRQDTTQLLMKHDRGPGGANHHDGIDTIDVNRLVELVDAVEDFNPGSSSALNEWKSTAADGSELIVRYVLIVSVAFTEPCTGERHELLQHLHAGAEDHDLGIWI